LVGDIALPKLTTKATSYHVAEGSAITQSAQDLGQVVGRPHTVGAYNVISRKLLKQSTPDAQAIVQNDFVLVLARAIENMMLHGSGSNGEPTGLENASNIQSATVATPGTPIWSDFMTTFGTIAALNGDDGEMGWALSPAVAGKLMGSAQASNYPRWILENEMIGGWKALHSGNVNNGYGFFGRFEKLVLALWGGLDVTIDPYTNATSGSIRIVALQEYDVLCREGRSFAYSSRYLA
jgi:hypothetical protein